MIVSVLASQRAFVLRDGQPFKYLEPGVHSVWAPFAQLAVEYVNVGTLSVELDAARLALVPEADLRVVTLAEHERAVVKRRGRPQLWLGAGTHQVWTVDRLVDRKTGVVTPLVTVDVYDTSSLAAPVLPADVATLAKSKDYVEATAADGCVVIRMVDGRLESVLGAGRHAAWATTRAVQLAVIDLRERIIQVNGQEVMTSDRVSLRLNLAATVKVADVVRLATVARAPDEVVYLAMQMAARDLVGTRSLDQLLGMRDDLARALTPVVREKAAALGLELLELGLKDVVLPGEMKDLLNKVIAAQKQAEANVIARREETAATRSMAQTAKVLQENPLLVRLKELEAWAELAGKVGKLNVVVGENTLSALGLSNVK